ncbi:unnamed protein product [Durusdinium trenchii]|uniref:Uncharacterized protein n=1 Tax=Durusdinium trenchii TaxID=1381693 RepID=A0ABP0JKE8_9DINO
MANCHEHELQAYPAAVPAATAAAADRRRSMLDHLNSSSQSIKTSASEWHAECQQLRAEMVSRERRDRRIRIVLVIAFVLIALVAYFQEEHKISDLKKEASDRECNPSF